MGTDRRGEEQMASTGTEAVDAPVSGTASKRQTGGSLGRFQPVDLPLLLPASFRVCPTVSSAKPPPPPLLPYPAGGLTMPSLWSRLLPPANLPSAWGVTGPPETSPLSCWMLPGPAPPLLPASAFTDRYCGQPALDEDPHRRKSREDETREADSGLDRPRKENWRDRERRDDSTEPEAKRCRADSVDNVVTVQMKDARPRSHSPPVHVQKLLGMASHDEFRNHRDTCPGKESGDLKNGESLVAEREAKTEKLKADPLRRRQADDVSSDQSSKWFNPQEKDYNFSWGETLDALQKPDLAKRFSNKDLHVKCNGKVEPVEPRESTMLSSDVVRLPELSIHTHFRGSSPPLKVTTASDLCEPTSHIVSSSALCGCQNDSESGSQADIRDPFLGSLSAISDRRTSSSSSSSQKEKSGGENLMRSCDQKCKASDVITCPTSTDIKPPRIVSPTLSANVPSTTSIAGRSSSSSEMKLPVLGESRRQKNNEAAKRSRDARRAKEDGVAVRCALLEAENVQLRLEMAWLKNETARLKYVLYST